MKRKGRNNRRWTSRISLYGTPILWRNTGCQLDNVPSFLLKGTLSDRNDYVSVLRKYIPSNLTFVMSPLYLFILHSRYTGSTKKQTTFCCVLFPPRYKVSFIPPFKRVNRSLVCTNNDGRKSTVYAVGLHEVRVWCQCMVRGWYTWQVKIYTLGGLDTLFVGVSCSSS